MQTSQKASQKASQKTTQHNSALIIGGNRFFGRQLALQLLASGSKVTLLNRGRTADQIPREFESRVERIHCDRKDDRALRSIAADRKWDVVYDQVCFDAREARSACEIFENKTRHYVFTSTVSVYDLGASISEDTFQPSNHRFEKQVSGSEDYGEAKRQAEFVFATAAPFPVCMARFPIVCGEDDYTQRLAFHIKRVMNNEPIYFPNLEARMSYIDSVEAGSCLKFLAETGFTGPVNCSSPDAVTMRELMGWIEQATGKRMILADAPSSENQSPYGVPSDYFPSTERLSDAGHNVRSVAEWLPRLIENLSRALDHSK